MRIRKLALAGIMALLPLMGLTPSEVKAESELPPVVSYIEQPILGEGELAPNLEEAERLYQTWLVAQEKAKSLKYRANIANYTLCSCVSFAKSLTGYQTPVGAARNWPKNTPYPVVGGVVITNESYAGHVAVITKINPDSIEVVEANYSRCQKTTRTILLNNPIVQGYWR